MACTYSSASPAPKLQTRSPSRGLVLPTRYVPDRSLQPRPVRDGISILEDDEYRFENITEKIRL